MTIQSHNNPFGWLAIICLFLTACTTPQITAIESANDSIVFLGRDPKHQDRFLYRVRDIELMAFNDVFSPAPDSLHLLNHTQIKPGETVLDIGTGTGIQAIFAARKAKHIIATDISPRAAENARINIKNHQLDHLINVRVGDLFSPLASEERFDVVLLNLKYPDPNTKSDLWKVHEHFFADVQQHLKPGGRIYYQFGYARNLPHVETMLAKNNLHIVEKFLAPAVVAGEYYITCVIQPKTTTE